MFDFILRVTASDKFNEVEVNGFDRLITIIFCFWRERMREWSELWHRLQLIRNPLARLHAVVIGHACHRVGVMHVRTTDVVSWGLKQSRSMISHNVIGVFK